MRVLLEIALRLFLSACLILFAAFLWAVGGEVGPGAEHRDGMIDGFFFALRMIGATLFIVAGAAASFGAVFVLLQPKQMVTRVTGDE